MSRTYFTLAAIENGTWAIQFGDYSEATVREELEDMAQTNLRKNLKIIRHRADDQASLNADYTALNGYNPDLTIVGRI